MTQISLPRGSNETGVNEWSDVYSNDNAITTVVNGQLSNDNVASNAAIAHSKLAAGTAGQLLIANGSGVITATTASGDVTVGGTGAVTIANSAVTTAKINDGAVTSAKIADGTIAAADIADGAVTAAKVSDNTLPYAKIKDDAWTSYTPTWTAANTNPTLGNGTLTGKYSKLGKTVHFRIKLTVGSTTNRGSGTYFFTLPFSTTADNAEVLAVGQGSMSDFYQGIVITYPSTFGGGADKVTMRVTSGPSDGNNISNGVPSGGSGTYIYLSGTYEAA